MNHILSDCYKSISTFNAFCIISVIYGLALLIGTEFILTDNYYNQLSNNIPAATERIKAIDLVSSQA